MKNAGRQGIVICTEPRSGSNFFCQLLASTGVLGRPLEYFNAPGRRAFDDPNYPDDPEAQLQIILERGSTSNGVYSFKVFSHQFDLTKSTRWPERLPGLHFVHLQRRDILGQAISRVRAEQTGKFRSYAAGHGGAEYYDSGAITRMLEQLVIGNARWAGYFAMTGTQPLPLYYEDVIADPVSAVSLTANLMAVTARLNLDAVDLRVQRDAVSEVWRKKYLGEENARDGLPRLLNGRPEALAQSFVRRLARRVQAPSSR